MFFDIAALANYFIAQKDQANPAVAGKTEKSDSVSFEDFMASLSGKSDSRKQGTEGTDPASAMPVSIFPQVVNESKGDKGEMPFYANFKNINPNAYQTALNSNNHQTEQTHFAQPVEAFESSIIPANELKDLVKSQAVTATLNIDQKLINNNNNNMNTDLNLLGNLSQIDKPLLSFADTNPEAVNKANQAETNLTKNFDLIDQGKSIDLSSYTKLSFTIDKLLNNDQAAMDIKAFDHNNNLIVLKAPVEQLKQLTKNYPDNIIVQIKPDIGSKQPDSMIDSIPTADKTEKFILFNLKSLIAAEDLDNIKIVHKTVANDQSNQGKSPASADLDLLSNLQSNKTRTINIKENTILHNKINEFNDSLDQPAIDLKKAFGFSQKDQPLSQANQTSTQTGNNLKSGHGQAQTEASGYSGIEGGKAAQITNEAGSSSNRSINDINSAQHLNLKTLDAPIDFKGVELLPGKNITDHNMEIAGKIIDQIKSKFETAPEFTRMTINLKPENLGKIRLDFEYEGEKIKALLQVDNAKVKSILDADLPRLKHELKIDSIKVEIALSDFKQNNNTPNQRSHFANHDSHHQPRYPKMNQQTELGGKINSEIMKSAKVNVHHGGIVNLFV